MMNEWQKHVFILKPVMYKSFQLSGKSFRGVTCVSAACKNDCLSSGFSESTDTLRRAGKKQRDCNLETRTS